MTIWIEYPHRPKRPILWHDRTCVKHSCDSMVMEANPKLSCPKAYFIKVCNCGKWSILWYPKLLFQAEMIISNSWLYFLFSLHLNMNIPGKHVILLVIPNFSTVVYVRQSKGRGSGGVFDVVCQTWQRKGKGWGVVIQSNEPQLYHSIPWSFHHTAAQQIQVTVFQWLAWKVLRFKPIWGILWAQVLTKCPTHPSHNWEVLHMVQESPLNISTNWQAELISKLVETDGGFIDTITCPCIHL